MKVLIIGGGGREHALVWKLAQSPLVSQIFAHPLNAGLAQLAEPVDVHGKATAFELVRFVERNKIELTVVGPESLLCAGIVDTFNNRGQRIFGPNQKAAQIESSKSWAKEFMLRCNIPTASHKVFMDYDPALEYVMEGEFPVVIKVDGLAAGKGVTVARNPKEAKKALQEALIYQAFGAAGRKVIIEEYLQGQEVSLLAITDGQHALPLLPAQDHKPLLDGDQGPNTGGMGAICPIPLVDEELKSKIMEEVFHPALKGFLGEGIQYTGVLYAGLMITQDGLKVLEFNCRFGDPEIQAILPLMKTDLLAIFNDAIDGRIAHSTIRWRENKTCVTVVMASHGYPGNSTKRVLIRGLHHFDPKDTDTQIFHAATQGTEPEILTSGGRVLGVTAVGDSPVDARENAYRAVDKIEFNGACYRKDIGLKAV